MFKKTFGLLNFKTFKKHLFQKTFGLLNFKTFSFFGKTFYFLPVWSSDG